MSNNYLDKNGLSYFWGKIKTYATGAARVGSLLVATQASDMTNTSCIYVYTGHETGYTYGDWYYYDGSAWRDGGGGGNSNVDIRVVDNKIKLFSKGGA